MNQPWFKPSHNRNLGFIFPPTGFLHASVYGADEPHLLGNLDVSKSKGDWSSLIICPSRDRSNKDQEKHLLLSGTPNLAFKVQVESSVEEIVLNKPLTFDLGPYESIKVFQFIPTEDISDMQLDVTVTSESDVPAYLKVSHDCEDVNENIDVVDYKGESIRLSFAKKGRITLSKVSIPPLTDSTSSWFIGIAIKNATGETPDKATKTVTLTLSRSFDYSYAGPIIFLVVVSIGCGVLVACCGICSFPISQEAGRQDCCELCQSWCKGPKSYSYITVIVGFVLMIGAGQFVFANWHLMIQEGDRDTCYYNDFCYRVSKYGNIPFNSMISNLAYMIHGLILAISVMYMEAKLYSRFRNSNDLPPKHAFSMGYAFAWALFFEGCFSLVYHLCPSKLTFQFDTGFMFVIAGLIVVLLYNGIEMKENSIERGLVDAVNFFLYFLVPLYIFNYVGTLSHSETGLVDAPPFFIFAAIWWIFIAIWTFWKVDLDCCSKQGVFFVIAFAIPFFSCGIISGNIPEAFLLTCILEDFIAIIGYFCCNWEKIEIEWAKRADTKCKIVIQVIYILSMAGLWIGAVCIFAKKATTDKSLTPEKSRDYNQDCILLNFFDYHDLWHILSSHALLMSAYFVMFISYIK